MPEPVALAEIKVHLRLDVSATSEDVYLQGLLTAARRAVEIRTARTIVGDEPTLTGDDLEAARHAMRLLVASWYLNREGDVPEPPQVAWLLESIKQWDDGACD
jgi:CTP:molybdopterin cytidylyltransferase MocA